MMLGATVELISAVENLETDWRFSFAVVWLCVLEVNDLLCQKE